MLTHFVYRKVSSFVNEIDQALSKYWQSGNLCRVGRGWPQGEGLTVVRRAGRGEKGWLLKGWPGGCLLFNTSSTLNKNIYDTDAIFAAVFQSNEQMLGNIK